MTNHYSKKFLSLIKYIKCVSCWWQENNTLHKENYQKEVSLCYCAVCLNWGLEETSHEFKFWVHLVSLHSAELWWGHTQQGLDWGHQLISFRIIHCQIVVTFTVTLRWTETSKPMAKEKNKMKNMSFLTLLSVKEWK